jgi:ElaB/YqjD/DUF883 family membrane-anchored ribosome-binding protein
MTTPTTNSLRSKDDVMNAAESALDSTRQLASQVIGRAGDKARELRYGAKDLASKGLGVATDATAAAQKQLSRYADVTGRYVSQQPVRSALIAVAAGAAIAALVIAARRRNSRY